PTLRPPPASTPFPYTTLFRSLPRRVIDVVALAERIEAVALTRMKLARERERVEHLADGGDLARLAGEPCELGIEERDVEGGVVRSEEHTSELQSPYDLVCRLL